MKNKLGVLLTLGALVILVGAGCTKTNSPTVDDQKNTESTENQTVKTETDDSNENEVENEVESDDTTKPTTNNTGSLVKPGGDTTAVDTGRSKLTVAEVAKHNTSDDCYIIVSGNVYDVTKFTFKHPGGSEAIIPLCGKDATAPFTQQHGGQSKPANVLAGLEIGPLQK